MIIRVDKLKNVEGDVHPIQFSLTEQELKDVSEVKLAEGALTFTGTVENKDRIIDVSGKICCVLQENCDRCGEKVLIPINVDFHESFTNLFEKSNEDDGEEAEIHFFTGDEINLLPYAEQAIFLVKPMKTLCKENCRGLCPQCGTNLNEKECSCDQSPIDPRLAVLADLMNKGL